MRLRRGSSVLIVLSAVVSLACGQGQSVTSDGANAVAKLPGAPVAPAPAAGPVFDAEAEYEKGAALAAARRFPDARQVFEEAARRAPADGALRAAVAIFADLAGKRVSEDAVHRLFQAGQHANAGQWAEAHADVDEAIRLAPGYARAHGLRGTLWLQQGKPADALEAFEQVVKLDPDGAEGHYNRGATYAALRRHDAAIADFSRAIELKSDFWDAYANRGLAHQTRGLAGENKQDLLNAMADYTKAHELNPAAVEPLYLRGTLFAAAEEWDDAVTDLTRVIERNGAHAGAYYNRGLAFQKQGDDTRAVADYTKAIELDPAGPAPLINRGMLYAKQKSYERAIADYDMAASVAPELLNPHYNKAQALERMDRAKEAAAEYRILLKKAGSAGDEMARLARERLAAIEKSPEN
jgi:tetratricopeptide (TPR) repeat protein